MTGQEPQTQPDLLAVCDVCLQLIADGGCCHAILRRLSRWHCSVRVMSRLPYRYRTVLHAGGAEISAS